MRFDRLIGEVQQCKLCARMCDSMRVLSWANGVPDAPLLFIGEAPGRLGADRTTIPFHGDKAGDNFERLLELAGINRSQIFVTNAVLCNPRDAQGNNATPSNSEIDNCARHLRRQIEIINPKMVMTLGNVALEATRRIELHELSLNASVRTANRWFGRLLLPLYHPGARALIHRSFANQTADYYFVGEQFRRLSKPSRSGKRPVRGSDSDWAIVEYLIRRSGPLSYFRLHKLMFLIEVASVTGVGRRATGFLYLRQKDGPYCVELGSRWYQRFNGEIVVKKINGSLMFSCESISLFKNTSSTEVSPHLKRMVDDLVASTQRLSDMQLKSRAYLTRPMKQVLKAERAGVQMINRPLLTQAA